MNQQRSEHQDELARTLVMFVLQNLWHPVGKEMHKKDHNIYKYTQLKSIWIHTTPMTKHHWADYHSIFTISVKNKLHYRALSTHLCWGLFYSLRTTSLPSGEHEETHCYPTENSLQGKNWLNLCECVIGLPPKSKWLVFGPLPTPPKNFTAIRS